MTFSGLALFAAIFLVFVALPGPGITMLIARSLSRGLHGLVWVVCGFLLGDLTLMTLAICGLAVVAHTFSGVFLVIRYAGAAYLLWMAVKIWRAPTRIVELPSRPVARDAWDGFFSSLSVTLSNPKAILFYLSIMPLVVPMNEVGVSSYALLALIMAVVMVPVLVAWASLANKARQLFRSEQAMARLNKGSASLIAGAAAVVLAK